MAKKQKGLLDLVIDVADDTPDYVRQAVDQRNAEILRSVFAVEEADYFARELSLRRDKPERPKLSIVG